MNGLDLFSGIAGNTIGLGEYVKTVAYCENDRHAQSILLSRMGDGTIEPAPIWDDITSLEGAMFNIPIDIITGGFPCQDISVAGKGKGLEGKRSGLFFEVCRLVKEINPRFVFLENVPALRTRGLRTVIREFTDMGYDCRWTCVSAGEVGAPHIRKRWFLLAYAECEPIWNVKQRLPRRRPEGIQAKRQNEFSNDGEKEHLADAKIFGRIKKYQDSSGGSEGIRKKGGAAPGLAQRGSAYIKRRAAQIPAKSWEVESNLDRVVNGVPLRVDRIKRLGNAVVPLQAKTAFKRLMGLID